MNSLEENIIAPPLQLKNAIDAAGQMIPPSWPLDSSVAVNPFFGQSTETLAHVAARLDRIGGIDIVMPRNWYQDKIERNEITDQDLEDALNATPYQNRPADIEALKNALNAPVEMGRRLNTVSELAAKASGTDWGSIIDDRFGLWAGGFFDQGQALWATSRRTGAWKSWRSWATHDLTPQILGLKDFCTYVDLLPSSPFEAITRVVSALNIPQQAMDTYFHQLLLSLGGWSQYARHEVWKDELEGKSNTIMMELLAIRLCWEETLYRQYQKTIETEWHAILDKHQEPVVPSSHQVINEILQEAAERSVQRALSKTFASNTASNTRPSAPLLQAAFCIDVRSEVYRRALEVVDPGVQTLGFAGFFGLTTEHKSFGSDVAENRFPVLLTAGLTSRTGSPDASMDATEKSHRYQARSLRAWGRFKLAAVSSFAFVEAMGPAYVVKLLRGAFGLQKMKKGDSHAPRFDPMPVVQDRIDAAEKILRAMSLTENFGKIVLITGHGGNVVNNPFASGLHCGACGGHAGDVNARLLATVLNDREVRSGLTSRNIHIPDDTLFIGALHDTTTDRVTVYDGDCASKIHKNSLKKIRKWLDKASALARKERMHRLPDAKTEKEIRARAQNWAEVRPEWGLAGCQAFIAAPRTRTADQKLDGKSFLHEYDWKQDQAHDFSVLELIMTAPVVVASWISLQYYGSSVAPNVFGSGDKLLHNVVGGIGVLEGNGGKLRAGLPWQSVHDGTKLAHEPLRLSVCIEAPIDAMTAILDKHESVRALFDNRWLHLFALDETGKMAWRYAGNLKWELFSTTDHTTPMAKAS
ncbi:YbcC family protein [Sneathiella aquimaris]|uniref:YbcC family protein n=1 Tax=Sneathiella aquimaris TaxID=2599305 RepID=UPI00146F5FD8|nr:DUF2309 domain-containing protein [Sneathiella aquimaris]